MSEVYAKIGEQHNREKLAVPFADVLVCLNLCSCVFFSHFLDNRTNFRELNSSHTKKPGTRTQEKNRSNNNKCGSDPGGHSTLSSQ